VTSASLLWEVRVLVEGVGGVGALRDETGIPLSASGATPEEALAALRGMVANALVQATVADAMVAQLSLPGKEAL